MLYADKKGKIFSPEEVEALPFWKIEKMGIHVYDDEPDEVEA
jgi:hypothetical protein